jgi:hypothetical protein
LRLDPHLYPTEKNTFSNSDCPETSSDHFGYSERGALEAAEVASISEAGHDVAYPWCDPRIACRSK